MNRIHEIRSRAGLAPLQTHTEHVAIKDPFKERLKSLGIYLDRLEDLCAEVRAAIEPAELIDAIEVRMSDIRETAKVLKDDLVSFKANCPDGMPMQIHVNLYQMNIRKLSNMMNRFSQVSHDFKKSMKDRTRRQLILLEVDEESSEKILNSNDPGAAMDALLIGEELDDVVSGIERRHQGIRMIETQVEELYELFKDLASLVDTQQETFDSNEHHINMTKQYARKAGEDLVEAEGHQKSSRRKQCFIVMLLLALLGIGAVVAVMA